MYLAICPIFMLIFIPTTYGELRTPNTLKVATVKFVQIGVPRCFYLSDQAGHSILPQENEVGDLPWTQLLGKFLPA